MFVGGMALFLHGYRRFTEGVDLLVTPDGLAKAHAAHEGRGYRPPLPSSKNLRDTENGVRIDFIISGEFPGDGKPKPVVFPDPTEAGITHEDISLLNVPALIELKLASGMTGAGRIKDLGDVQELIKLLKLPSDYADGVSPFVQGKYKELWQSAAGISEQEE